MSFIFFAFFFDDSKILEHTLQFVDLLHATRDLEIRDKKSLKVNVFWFLGQQPSCEEISVDHQEEILIYKVWKETDYVLQHVFLILWSFICSFAQKLVCEIGKELGHWILAYVDIDKFLERELKLSCE